MRGAYICQVWRHSVSRKRATQKETKTRSSVTKQTMFFKLESSFFKIFICKTHYEYLKSYVKIGEYTYDTQNLSANINYLHFVKFLNAHFLLIMPNCPDITIKKTLQYLNSSINYFNFRINVTKQGIDRIKHQEKIGS